jgi:hypothetical protein
LRGLDVVVVTSPPIDPPIINRAPRIPILNDVALNWAKRGVWVVCVAVYLIVFLGGLWAGSEELRLLARAAALTLVAGVLGRIGLGFLARASTPGEEIVPMAEPERKISSLLDQYSESKVAGQVEAADMTETVDGVDMVRLANAA